MGPLYWVHLAWSDCHKITPRLESILLMALKTLDVSLPPHVFPSRQPIPDAPCVFTDANKTAFGLLVKTPNEPDFHHIETHSGSVQLGELQAIITTLQKYQDTPLNIFSDSKYSVQAATSLPFSVFRPTESQIDQALQALKCLTENRRHPWFITHVRSHQAFRE
ncbi:endogenous retrovirus group K member 8 Pol protein-like protein [Leptotrombidium deliense]|uniref:Endogenous retrovirus group K member 8 Pol protein-like protein n=1 Tax=Leptotrombidium deliense TaxID=299467 RepID=A0A443RSU4_9ACAR|nr:endogenous retrovirus group K member 8 Pol protein-like protein [Leptotrombidium deliense]